MFCGRNVQNLLKNKKTAADNYQKVDFSVKRRREMSFTVCEANDKDEFLSSFPGKMNVHVVCRFFFLK
jgi:hypothetical protein